jgi:hypothetical protein
MKTRYLTITLTSILLTIPLACRDAPSGGDHEGEGEEPGVRLGIDETYDVVRKGVRLVLAYDSNSSGFAGTVQNVTDETVPAVRVEVHLSNGTELGPTTRNDLKPGRKIAVKLPAKGQTFDWWKAHAEAGEGEGEHGGEGSGEHAGEHEGERSGEHK